MPGFKLNLRERLEDTELDLSMSEIDDVPVKEIAQIKKATSLDLSNNHVKSLAKNFAPMLIHLVKLDLSNNHLSELPENFGEMVNLRHLDLYNNQLTHLPLSLGQLKNLRWLDLKNNPLIARLTEVAGPCLDAQQCQQCAKKVVNFLQGMQVQVAEERQRRLLQKRKQQELAEQAEKKQQQQQQSQKNKKKKAAKSSSNTQVKTENGATMTAGSNDNANVKKTPPKHQSEMYTRNKPVTKVSSLLYRMLKAMLFGAVLTLLALWTVYLVDEETFRGIQSHTVKVWNETVAALPPQVVETGQKIKEMAKPTLEFTWSKAQDAYVWFNTDPTVQEYVEVCKALWNAVYEKVYDICRTVNEQFPLYVETVKKKLF